jgi:4'-phosphopantetheinyl transferase
LTTAPTPYREPVPEVAEVHVWWAHTGDLTDDHLELLDEQERGRWSRYQRRDDRDRFALGSAVVRSLVAELDGTLPQRVTLDRTCPRCGEQHGPVTTPDRGFRCSVTHSGPFAVAAVVAASAATAVGVDLETRCPPEWTDLLPDVLASDETPPVDEHGFLALWVRKEAVVKAYGDGLSRPMSSFSVSGAAAHARLRSAAPSLQLADLDVAPLRAAGVGAPVAAALAVGAAHVRVRWRRAPI